MGQDNLTEAMEEALSIPQAAKLLGVSERFIRNAIIAKKLPSFFLGGVSAAEPHRGGGPGRGWRVWRSVLQKWYFGGPAPKD